MPTILIIEKNGNVKESNIKVFDEENLYKKAGFKTNEDFKCHTTWDLEINSTKYSISLYGKTQGRANQENKYEMPPPLDNTLFFGSCILVNNVDDVFKSVSAKEWEIIYETLYGGFEDIGEEDSDDCEGEDEYDDLEKTKTGYAKDGFIVDDDDTEIEDDELEFTESDSEEVAAVVAAVKSKKKAPSKKKKSEKKTGEKTIKVDTSDQQYLDCTNELEMEEYLDEL